MARSDSGLAPLRRRASSCGSSLVISQKATAMSAIAIAQTLATVFQP